MDLNRNFPSPAHTRDVWHPLAGTRFRGLPWYRGPGPLSEPESRAVADLAEELRPRAALSLHSAGRLFLYPFACQPEPPAREAAFQAMGEAFRAKQKERYEVKQSRTWYTILGDCDDWMFDRFGTLAVTVELGRMYGGVRNPLLVVSQLAFLNPPDPSAIVGDTVDACLAALAMGASLADATPPCP